MSPPPDAAPSPPPLEAFGSTHAGGHREDNEDTFVLASDLRLYMVADGMGGRAGGAVAARMAVDELEAFVRQRHASPRDPWPFPMDPQVSFGANLMRVGLQVANRRIREAGSAAGGSKRMGATFAALTIGTTQLVVAHLGDVRVYRLRGPLLKRLTRDHSLAEEVLAARPDMSRAHMPALARQNVVTRALGIKDEVDPTVYINNFSVGDLYLLCSDGLWGCVDDDRIRHVLATTRDLEAACQRLIDDANEAGGPDNITTVLVRVA